MLKLFHFTSTKGQTLSQIAAYICVSSFSTEYLMFSCKS